ncbi:MAG: hypothetical protein L6R36_007021 [Xanthoria steineri]|nr:MAG: hypothetical protein L6R36_007021 [Xanthoria steineri]
MAEALGLAATASLLEISTKLAKSLTNFDGKHDAHGRWQLQGVKIGISLSLEKLSDVEANRENQPCSRFKKATESITCKQLSTSIQALYDHCKILSDLIDELWISANTALDLRHGLMATETKPPGSEQLLVSGLHSRIGSPELFLLCSKQTEDCNLDMDLHDYATSPSYCSVTEPSSQEIR